MLLPNSATARFGRAGLAHATRAGFGFAAGILGFGHRTGYVQGPAGNLAFESGSFINQAGRFGLSALSSGVGSARGLPGLTVDYFRGQHGINKELSEARRTADSLSTADDMRYYDTLQGNASLNRGRAGAPNSKLAGKSAASVVEQFGKVDGHRKFAARGFGDHMMKAQSNTFKHGLFSSAAWGLNIGLAAFTSEGDLFDPYNGPGRALATNVGAEIGGAQGMGIGAAIGMSVGGIPGAVIGLVAGAVVGSEIGGAVADLPWKMSEFGNKHGRRSISKRSGFHDSEAASTMRQRSMQSIRRSQMNARSAMGNEAMAYHS